MTRNTDLSILRVQEIGKEMTGAKGAISTITVYLIALLVCVLDGASWLLDGPSESDLAATVALDLNDAITAAQAAAKEQP